MHDNPDVSNVEKFNYLSSVLEGPAASSIEGFSLTNENYEAAIKLLKDRFANPQIVVSSHMDALLKIKAVEDLNDLTSIRSLFDKIETCPKSGKFGHTFKFLWKLVDPSDK